MKFLQAFITGLLVFQLSLGSILAQPIIPQAGPFQSRPSTGITNLRVTHQSADGTEVILTMDYSYDGLRGLTALVVPVIEKRGQKGVAAWFGADPVTVGAGKGLISIKTKYFNDEPGVPPEFVSDSLRILILNSSGTAILSSIPFLKTIKWGSPGAKPGAITLAQSSPSAEETANALKTRQQAEAQAKARREAEEKAKAEARAIETSRAKAEAETKALEKADQEAQRLAEKKAQQETERTSREEARLRAEAEAKRLADEKRLAETKAREEAKARAEARRQAEAEAKARLEAEKKERAEAALREAAQREAEAEEKRLAEAARNAEEKAKAEARAQEKARLAAEAKQREEARRKAEAEAKRLAEERKQAEAKAQAEADARERERLRAEAEEKARREAERKERAEAEARETARLKAEAETKRLAEEKRLAEKKAKAEADEIARAEAAARETARINAENQAKRLAEAKRPPQAEVRSPTQEITRGEAAPTTTAAPTATAVAVTGRIAALEPIATSLKTRITNVDVVNRTLDRSQMTIGVEYDYRDTLGPKPMLGVDVTKLDDPSATKYFSSNPAEIGKSRRNFVLFPIKFQPSASLASLAMYPTDHLLVYLSEATTAKRFNLHPATMLLNWRAPGAAVSAMAKSESANRLELDDFKQTDRQTGYVTVKYNLVSGPGKLRVRLFDSANPASAEWFAIDPRPIKPGPGLQIIDLSVAPEAKTPSNIVKVNTLEIELMDASGKVVDRLSKQVPMTWAKPD
ncbi:MAG: hypothetical protein HY735_06210 [Verrucomicrobia bacterium]|nr:hypothetical protein [Verrucomicrobiota bacterium]